MESAYKSFKKQLDNVVPLLVSEYPDNKKFTNAVELLKKPEFVIKGKLKVKMDNGSVREFIAFRSEHNDARGPFKGGIRFHPGVSEDEVMALSSWMSIKCAVAGIPYGGGKGGIIVDPKLLSQMELQKLCFEYAKLLTPYIGPWKDVPAPDVNTGGREMAWMLEAYEKNVGYHSPATFTGKPIPLGGSLGREEATGQGGLFVLNAYVKAKKLNPKKLTVAVQGFGNVGFWFAKLAVETGYKIVAVSDSSSGAYNPKGLDINKVFDLKKKYVSFIECPKNSYFKSITNEELLTLKADILAPAALENVITIENAGSVRVSTILELGNGPTTPEAEEILLKKKIDVIPDVLGNAGGVTVSYFEWVQNLHGYSWTKERVNEELKVIMDKAFHEIYEVVKIKKISYRKAAYVLAVKKIVDAMILRGRV